MIQSRSLVKSELSSLYSSMRKCSFEGFSYFSIFLKLFDPFVVFGNFNLTLFSISLQLFVDVSFSSSRCPLFKRMLESSPKSLFWAYSFILRFLTQINHFNLLNLRLLLLFFEQLLSTSLHVLSSCILGVMTAATVITLEGVHIPSCCYDFFLIMSTSSVIF